MILRRIAKGIKNQDWFVVMVEVMIVVVGIFIGLQVDDWNEERKNRVIEANYLQRLSADLEADIEQFEIGVRLIKERREFGELLMASVTNSSLVEKDPTTFMQALVEAGFTFSPSISDHTFEEIKSSGKLALIRDVGVRSGLTRYYTTIRSAEQWGYLREQEQTGYLERSRGILDYHQERLFWGDPSEQKFSAEEVSDAYQRMLANQAFLEWLPLVTNREMNLNNYHKWSLAASNLLNAIKTASMENGN